MLRERMVILIANAFVRMNMPKYRHLGHSGLEVSEIGIGTNNFGGRLEYQESKAVINAALDQGINLFDTADIYTHGVSEEYIGRALEGRRQSAIIATKFGMEWEDGPHGVGASRKRMTDALDGSLARLQTDYIDLYQVHRQDPATPIEETLRALDDAGFHQRHAGLCAAPIRIRGG